MAEFTKLDDGAVRRIARMFGVDGVTAWRPIAAGTINSNFAIEAGSARYFLRINEGKAEADVQYESKLVEALIERGVPTPLPVATDTGQRYGVWQGQFVSLFPWVDGSHRTLGHVAPADARAVGVALARLHQAGAELTEEFTRSGIYTFDHIIERLDQFRAIEDAHLAGFVGPLAEEATWLASRRATRDAAVRGIIHGDLFRDNVMFDDHGDAVLIDFEQASDGSLVYDLAVCVNAWCFVEAFQPPLVRAMVAGYTGVRALHEAERAALWTELRAAAMRFTVTRITDVYLPGHNMPGKEFERYFRRLAAWRELGESGLAQWIS